MADGKVGFDPQATRKVLSKVYYCFDGGVKTFARASIPAQPIGDPVGDTRIEPGRQLITFA